MFVLFLLIAPSRSLISNTPDYDQDGFRADLVFLLNFSNIIKLSSPIVESYKFDISNFSNFHTCALIADDSIPQRLLNDPLHPINNWKLKDIRHFVD